MTSLKWCLLAKKFFEFRNAAEPLGFYVPELEAMEKSLMECRPFGDDEETMRRVADLVETGEEKKAVDTNRHIEAFKVVLADEHGFGIDADEPAEWLGNAIEAGTVYYDSTYRNMGWYVSYCPSKGRCVRTRIDVGDYILYDASNGNIYTADGYLNGSLQLVHKAA